jgi:hypothetical protein
MAGFFSNLFGRKNNDNDQPKEAFFLDSDDAKSLGDLDYMRTPNVIRRTFPKTASDPVHKELIQSYTATGKTTIKMEGLDKVVKPSNAPAAPQTNSYVIPSAPAAPAASSFSSSSSPSPAPAAAPAPAAPSEPAPRRSGDDGMDMFRSMAKNLGR